MRGALLAAIFVAASAYGHENNCQSTPATDTARHVLAADEKDLDARFALADALIASNCFDDAVHVLEQGEPLHGRNVKLQARLREARSMLGEQRYFEGLNEAEENAKLSRNTLRCAKLADLQACDQALQQKPEDPDILIAKGDALLQASRPLEALTMYRRVATIAPGRADVESKSAVATAQQDALVTACETTTGQQALQSCERAIVPGDRNSFALLKRKGTLLQAANQPSAALDAFIAANGLKPGDRAVALAIVALSDSSARRDAVTLAARGAAFLTVNRPADALDPLRQALALTPGAPEVASQLARAQRLAREERKRQAVATPVPDEVGSPVLTANEPSRRYSNTAPATQSQ